MLDLQEATGCPPRKGMWLVHTRLNKGLWTMGRRGKKGNIRLLEYLTESHVFKLYCIRGLRVDRCSL